MVSSVTGLKNSALHGCMELRSRAQQSAKGLGRSGRRLDSQPRDILWIMVRCPKREVLAAVLAFLVVVFPAARASGQSLPAPDASPEAAQECTQLLQAHDAKSVEVCKMYRDQAEAGPSGEHMARIIANDEYGIALLAYAHAPQQGLAAFNREIGMLPESTVRPDSLQWASAYWHRATAYQQLGQADQAIQDLRVAEDTLHKAASASAGDPQMKAHFEELRKRVLEQHAGLLEQQGKHAEAQKVLNTQ